MEKITREIIKLEKEERERMAAIMSPGQGTKKAKTVKWKDHTGGEEIEENRVVEKGGERRKRGEKVDSAKDGESVEKDNMLGGAKTERSEKRKHNIKAGKDNKKLRQDNASGGEIKEKPIKDEGIDKRKRGEKVGDDYRGELVEL